MTEQEWLACTNPKGMVEFVDTQASDRKKRLFAVACCRRIWCEEACCRRIWIKIPDPRVEWAVEVVERFADGLANGSDREAAVRAVSTASQENREWTWGDPDACEGPGGTWNVPFHDALSATAVICGTDQLVIIDHVYRGATRRIGSRFKGRIEWMPGTEHMPEEGMDTSDLIREIFGNPFRPVTLDAAWRTPTVLALATAAYENHILPAGTLEPARVGVLADALEDVGCTNEAILSHCRGPGPHVRGCWVIDLLLGKE
jgi:hypothetical protein